MTMIKIERALNALHASPVGDAAQDPWDDRQAEEVGRAVLGCFRSGSDAKGVERRAAVGTLPEELLRRVFAYIERNLDSKLKWDELAAAVGLDPFRFARGFKRATGTTPHRYIMAARIRRAMELLTGQGASIADVALDVGCSCQSHLTTLFRKYTGTTPAAFRRSAAESRRVLALAAASAASAPSRRSEPTFISESAPA